MKNILITLGRGGKQNGLEYNGKRVIISGDGGRTFKYSGNRKTQPDVDDFKKLVDLAALEHEKTIKGKVDAKIRLQDIIPTEEVRRSVLNNSMEEIYDTIDQRREEVVYMQEYANITENDVKKSMASKM